MNPPTQAAIRQALRAVPYPGFSRDIVDAGVVESIGIEHGEVTVRLALANDNPQVLEAIREQIRRVLEAIDGITAVHLPAARGGPTRLPVAGQPAPGRPSVQSASARAKMVQAKSVIGVASGKGGVGKSTVAVNLAVELARRGHRVGFLDADVHGPSAPLMFGLEGRRPERADADGRPLPLEAFGVRVMSMGFFVERDSAVIWRGPIVGNFIRQLLSEIAWGELDELIIDFPPGTGDAQLTISQSLRMTGSIVVTTPNDLALIDALKAIHMFRKVEVPVFGLVENMSFFVCPHCDKRTDIFGESGVARAAREQEIPLIGRIPIDPHVVRLSDSGRPLVLEQPESLAARSYREIAAAVLEQAREASTQASGGLGSFLDRFGRQS
ncbi:MAG: Mrp/NBP35 family ATP-binding protein [Acidobacteriota bacterium]|nr:MAG: Mrp/NBP35 family ATP-binding protein [Acidobacteriota bacterium]